MSETVLDVRNLQVDFVTDEKIIAAAQGISFKLEQGQTLGIVGESGSGKSVTSLALMGLVPSPGIVSGGEIWFKHEAIKVDLLKLSQEQMLQYRGGKIAMVFQEPMSALNPVYTCGFQLIEAILRHQRVSKIAAQNIALNLLQEVKLLPSDEELVASAVASNPALHQNKRKLDREVAAQKQALLDRYPHQLSGGQLQRVTIAMAISCNPAVLIADEPTTALDVTVQATILDLLRELSLSRQMAMIFITHDLGLVAEIADSIAVMYKGKIVECGLVESVFSQPQHPYTKGLLACRPNMEVRSQYLLTVADFMGIKPTAMGGNLEIEEKSPPSPPEVTPEALQQRLTQLLNQNPLLDVRDLQVGFRQAGAFGQTKRYFMAVKGVSFQVYPGETLGLVGESGCGKTTLGRTLLRLIAPISGSVMFDGQNVANTSGHALQKLRQEMQIIFQNPFSSLDPRLKIGDAIVEPLVIHGRGNGDRHRRKIAGELLERVGLDSGLLNRYPHEFSGGQRQRICIARALALRPKFIICDESVSSLDVSVQAQVLNLLKELQQEFNLTYIFISHDLNVVKFMSDRILVMNQGQIVEQGAAESIYRSPQQEYTRRLIASIPTGEKRPQSRNLF